MFENRFNNLLIKYLFLNIFLLKLKVSIKEYQNEKDIFNFSHS